MLDMFDGLEAAPADPLLALISAYAADERQDKIDLGVGVYRDADGRTPVMGAVKAAERRLAEAQESKSYLGPEGNGRFADLLADLTFGPSRPAAGELGAVQTPGGTGALRLAAELIRHARPQARVWLMKPTWPNHPPIFCDAGLALERIGYLGRDGRVDVGAILDGLNAARPGDAVVVHGCCHNPTGQDLRAGHWVALTDLVRERGLLPVVDLAYHGLGNGLEADAAGLRAMAAPTAARIARGMYSMPPERRRGGGRNPRRPGVGRRLVRRARRDAAAAQRPSGGARGSAPAARPRGRGAGHVRAAAAVAGADRRVARGRGPLHRAGRPHQHRRHEGRGREFGWHGPSTDGRRAASG